MQGTNTGSTQTSVPVTTAEMDELLRRAVANDPFGGTTTTTADLAEALRIPESEVLKMLAQLRLENQTLPASAIDERQKWKRRDQTFAIGAGLASIAVLLVTLFLTGLMIQRPAPVERLPAMETAVMAGPEAPPATISLAPGGLPESFTLDGNRTEIFFGETKSAQTLIESVEKTIATNYPKGPLPASSADLQYKLDEKGRIRVPFEFRHKDSNNVDLVAWRGTLPVYLGDDGLTEVAVRKEREKLLTEAFEALGKLPK